MFQYYGVYAPPPLEAVVSPNGDGIAEEQKLSFKVVRPSTVTVTLTAPDGSIAWQESGARDPGTYDVAFPPLPPPPPPPPEGQPPPEPVPTEPLPPAEGRWTFTASCDGRSRSRIDDHASIRRQLDACIRSASHRHVSSSDRPAGRMSIRWAQARAARVKVTIETPEGIVVRTATSAPLQAGEQSVIWDGRAGNRKLVAGGAYVARVTATNELGAVSLTQPLTVRRVKG